MLRSVIAGRSVDCASRGGPGIAASAFPGVLWQRRVASALFGGDYRHSVSVGRRHPQSRRQEAAFQCLSNHGRLTRTLL